MKKIHFWTLAALALLGSSCSNDETLEVSDSSKKAIAFQSAFINNATRADNAADPSYSNTSLFSNFSVWGTMSDANGWLFDGVQVSGSGTSTSGNWTYTDTRYWTAGKTYSFAAVAPASYKANVSAVTTGALTGGLKVSYTANDGGQGDDLLYAAPADVTAPETLTTADPGKVQLNFYHVLSKVKFTFKHGTSTETESAAVKFDVKGIKITNANTSADITMSGNTVASDNVTVSVDNYDNSKNKSIEFGDAGEVTSEKPQESANERILIPEDRSNKENDTDKWVVTFTVDVIQGEVTTSADITKTCYVAANLEPKKAYNFVAELTYENVVGDKYPIEFNVQNVENWENPSPEDTSVTVNK